MKIKRIETRIIIYDKTVKDQVNEVGFTERKVKRKLALRHK